MDRASVIVAVVGWSSGLQWEFATLAARGHFAKTMFVFPPFGEDKKHGQRVEWFKQLFSETEHGGALRDANLHGSLLAHGLPAGRLVMYSGIGEASEYETALNAAIYGLRIYKPKAAV
jgi:hypothetical protein